MVALRLFVGTQCLSCAARYLQAVAESLRRWFPNRPIFLRLGHPPDEDLVFMASATEFLPSGGGFSDVIASLVQHFGGRVARPSTWKHSVDLSEMYRGAYLRCPHRGGSGRDHPNAGKFLC